MHIFALRLRDVGTKVERVKANQTMQAQIGQQKCVEDRGTGWQTDKRINSHWLDGGTMVPTLLS